jgi:hypothetical protein
MVPAVVTQGSDTFGEVGMARWLPLDLVADKNYYDMVEVQGGQRVAGKVGRVSHDGAKGSHCVLEHSLSMMVYTVVVAAARLMDLSSPSGLLMSALSAQ